MCLLISFLLNFSSISNASVFLDPGIYVGSIHPSEGSPDIPIQFSFGYSNEEEPADPGELIPIKKVIEGSFIVDHEGGPYNLAKIDHDIDSGEVDMKYIRPDLAVGPPALRFHGILSHNKIKGTVKSGLKGSFGTFEIEKTDLLPHGIDYLYTGLYRGQFHYEHPDNTVAMKIRLGPGSRQVTNPVNDYELGFTPGHNDSFELKTWEQNATHTFIDYLRRTITLEYVGPTGTLTLSGQVYPDRIVGEGVGSYKSHLGTFEVRKMKDDSGH